jgi:hypothetical protein
MGAQGCRGSRGRRSSMAWGASPPQPPPCAGPPATRAAAAATRRGEDAPTELEPGGERGGRGRRGGAGRRRMEPRGRAGARAGELRTGAEPSSPPTGRFRRAHPPGPRALGRPRRVRSAPAPAARVSAARRSRVCRPHAAFAAASAPAASARARRRRWPPRRPLLASARAGASRGPPAAGGPRRLAAAPAPAASAARHTVQGSYREGIRGHNGQFSRWVR